MYLRARRRPVKPSPVRSTGQRYARRMRASLAVVAACATPAVAPATAPRTSPLEIATDRGVIVGHARDGVREFLGIAYAAPPVGALRWRPPAPAAAWTAPRD